jgi:hypothetical protein
LVKYPARPVDDTGREFTRPVETAPMNDLNVLALFKGEEKFIFVYDDASRAELLDTIRDLAADPLVSMTWFDAAVLTERAKQQALQAAANDEATRY